MKRILLITLTVFMVLKGISQDQSSYYIVIPEWFAVMMRNTQSLLDRSRHFDDTIRTKGGRYVCNVVNFQYFSFDTLVKTYGKISAELLPVDSFPAPVVVYTIGH